MNAHIQVELQEWMGSDQSIANAAWTSTYNKEKRESKYDEPANVERIVRGCVRYGHTVPIESVVFRFWIRHPIFTDRQHMTHRIASHNGLSARYRTMPGDWFSIPEDVKYIADKIGINHGRRLQVAFDTECRKQLETYEEWLEFFKAGERNGAIDNAEYKRAREIVRSVLGTAFMVERTSILNLHSVANYFRLRLSSHAQAEIRDLASQMLDQVKAKNICPIAIEALQENNWRLG